MTITSVNATLSDADRQDIKDSIQVIQAKLPFLVNLTPVDRKRLYKLGDRRLAFLQTSLSVAQSNRNILPASFDIDEFANDCQLVEDLNELLMLLRQLTEQVDDTVTTVGSEAMTSSLTVYEYVKTAAKSTPGLKAIADQMGSLFKSFRNRTPKTVEETGSTTGV